MFPWSCVCLCVVCWWHRNCVLKICWNVNCKAIIRWELCKDRFCTKRVKRDRQKDPWSTVQSKNLTVYFHMWIIMGKVDRVSSSRRKEGRRTMVMGRRRRRSDNWIRYNQIGSYNKKGFTVEGSDYNKELVWWTPFTSNQDQDLSWNGLIVDSVKEAALVNE